MNNVPPAVTYLLQKVSDKVLHARNAAKEMLEMRLAECTISDKHRQQAEDIAGYLSLIASGALRDVNKFINHDKEAFSIVEHGLEAALLHVRALAEAGAHNLMNAKLVAEHIPTGRDLPTLNSVASLVKEAVAKETKA